MLEMRSDMVEEESQRGQGKAVGISEIKEEDISL